MVIEFISLVLLLIVVIVNWGSGYFQRRYLDSLKMHKIYLTGIDLGRKIIEEFKIKDLDFVENFSLDMDEGYFSISKNNFRKGVIVGPSVYNGKNIAGIFVMAHECFHAVQYTNFIKRNLMNSKIILETMTILCFIFFGLTFDLQTGIVAAMLTLLLKELLIIYIEADCNIQAVRYMEKNIIRFKPHVIKNVKRLAFSYWISYTVTALMIIIGLLYIYMRH